MRRRVVAPHERAAGVGQALDRLALRVVHAAQFDRILLRGARDLVDQRGEGGDAFENFARTQIQKIDFDIRVCGFIFVREVLQQFFAVRRVN